MRPVRGRSGDPTYPSEPLAGCAKRRHVEVHRRVHVPALIKARIACRSVLLYELFGRKRRCCNLGHSNLDGAYTGWRPADERVARHEERDGARSSGRAHPTCVFRGVSLKPLLVAGSSK